MKRIRKKCQNDTPADTGVHISVNQLKKRLRKEKNEERKVFAILVAQIGHKCRIYFANSAASFRFLREL